MAHVVRPRDVVTFGQLLRADHAFSRQLFRFRLRCRDVLHRIRAVVDRFLNTFHFGLHCDRRLEHVADSGGHRTAGRQRTGAHHAEILAVLAQRRAGLRRLVEPSTCSLAAVIAAVNALRPLTPTRTYSSNSLSATGCPHHH